MRPVASRSLSPPDGSLAPPAYYLIFNPVVDRMTVGFVSFVGEDYGFGNSTLKKQTLLMPLSELVTYVPMYIDMAIHPKKETPCLAFVHRWAVKVDRVDGEITLCAGELCTT